MSQPPGWGRRRWRQDVAVAALAAMVLGAAAGCGQTARRYPSLAPAEATPLARGSATSSPRLALAPGAPAAASATVPTASATAAPASALAPRPLLDVSGRGFRATRHFRTPAAWTITYRFDCARYGAEGNFEVVVYTQGQLVEVAVNRVAWSGRGAALELQAAGETYLQINSECDWQVVARP